MTAVDSLKELAKVEPLLSQVEAAQRVGVSRERLRQLVNKHGLPFCKANRIKRIVAAHHEGLDDEAIASLFGRSLSRIQAVLSAHGLQPRKPSRVCAWCGRGFQPGFRQKRRKPCCSEKCSNSHKQSQLRVKRLGNLPCLRCGTPLSEYHRHPCPGYKKHLFRSSLSEGHCKWGHKFSPKNTYTYSRSGRKMRRCRACHRKRARDYYQRQRERTQLTAIELPQQRSLRQ